MHVTTSQISGKNHISSFQTKPSRAEKTRKSSILARGKSCVLPTDPFFTREIDYIQMYPSDRYRSCWQMICNYKTRRRNNGLKCLSTGSHPFPSVSSRFFHPLPKQGACLRAQRCSELNDMYLIKFKWWHSSARLKGLCRLVSLRKKPSTLSRRMPTTASAK